MIFFWGYKDFIILIENELYTVKIVGSDSGAKIVQSKNNVYFAK